MSSLKLFLRSFLPFIIAVPLLLGVEQVLSISWTFIAIVAGINVILAVSLNVVNGFTGQFSIGHAGFMAVGAYTAAKITTAMHGLQIVGLSAGMSDQVVFFGALVAGMVLAGLAGLVVGMPSLRLRGDYLAIVTLGFNEIIRVIIENTPFLGQATGISGLPRLTSVMWVGMGVVATVVMARRLVGSTHGRALLAIREDEIAAEAMGVDTTRAKLRAFVLASLFPAVAGGLYAFRLSYVDPSSAFPAAYEIQVILMAIFGGAGTVFGPLAGGILLAALGEALWARFAELHLLLFGLIIVIVLRYMPEGLLALLRRRVA
ncbi:MAG: branched-chain amino acid ABC transporter permease [Myxococcales bacterium]